MVRVERGAARAAAGIAHWSAWAALGGTAIALVGATVGAANPYLDLAAQFLGLGGWACAAAAVVFSARRRITAALAAFALAGAALWIVWPRTAIKACLNEETRRVAFQNVWAWNRTPEAAVAYFREIDADFVVLAEVRRRFRGALVALRTIYPYTMDCRAIPRCDLTILSKFPFADMRAAALVSGSPDAMIVADIALPEGHLSVVGAHPARPWPFSGALVQRRETGALAEGFAALPAPRVLVADLNAVTWGYVVRQIEGRAEAQALPSWGTWLSRIPPPFSLPIDQAFVGPGVLCAKKTVGPYNGSDHRPIVVDFAIDPGAAEP